MHTPADARSEAGVDAGLDPERRVVDLTDSEWAALCNWIEAQRGGARAMYSCDGTSMLPAGEMCPAGHVCYGYYWLASDCLLAPELWPTEDGRARWRDAPRDCAVTVATYEACVRARSQLDCWVAYPEPIECESASCTGSLGDAGFRDAGP